MVRIEDLENLNLIENEYVEEKEFPQCGYVKLNNSVYHVYEERDSHIKVQGEKEVRIKIDRILTSSNPNNGFEDIFPLVPKKYNDYALLQFGDSCNKNTFAHPSGAFYSTKLIGVENDYCLVEYKTNNILQKTERIHLTAYYGASRICKIKVTPLGTTTNDTIVLYKDLTLCKDDFTDSMRVNGFRGQYAVINKISGKLEAWEKKF